MLSLRCVALLAALGVARACPPAYFPSGGLCRPCPPCPPPLLLLVPCGPTAGVCGSGITVTVQIDGADPRNLTYNGTVWPAAAYDTAYATCPPDQYHSDADDLCHACRNCTPPLIVESVPCSFASDRVCVPAIVVSVVASGVDFLLNPAALANFSAQPVASEDIAVDVELIPCTSAQFRSPETQLCTPCTACAPGQAELRPCLPFSDRLCNNSLLIELAILGAAGVNLSLLNLTQLLGGLDFALAQQPEIGLTVVPLPCPSGSYLDAPALLCLACTDCGPNSYMAASCGSDYDTTCRNCTACGYGAVTAAPCARTRDAICVGAVDVEFYIANGTQFNVSLVDSGSVSALLIGYDVAVARLVCAEGEFLDRGACSPCSACPPTAYMLSACTNVSDIVCQPCITCALGTYEACPCDGPITTACPTRDRLCYAYAAFNVTLNLSLASLYGYGALSSSRYLPTFLASVRAQTVASSASLSYLGARPYASNASLYPLASYAPSPPLLLDFILLIDGVYAQTPNPSRDYSVILERALYAADAAAVPGAPGYAGPSRRALADCPADAYAVSYPLLPLSQCVPCQDDPLLAATASTPPSLLYAVAADPCPPDYARICYGGTVPPICVLRLAGALLYSASADLVVLDCPQSQEQAFDPSTDAPLCVGIPCAAGSTGPAGDCVLCPAGTYKPFAGPDACSPCPLNTFQPLPGRTNLSDCAPCPFGGSSPAAATACVCNAGYAGDGSVCGPCAPGAYARTTGLASCLPCPAGTFQASQRALSCALCPAGTYQPNASASACLLCPAGQYQPLLATDACLLCPVGSYTTAGAPLYSPCANDTYSPAQGLSACLACPPGSYSPAAASACRFVHLTPSYPILSCSLSACAVSAPTARASKGSAAPPARSATRAPAACAPPARPAPSPPPPAPPPVRHAPARPTRPLRAFQPAYCARRAPRAMPAPTARRAPTPPASAWPPAPSAAPACTPPAPAPPAPTTARTAPRAPSVPAGRARPTPSPRQAPPPSASASPGRATSACLAGPPSRAPREASACRAATSRPLARLASRRAPPARRAP